MQICRTRAGPTNPQTTWVLKRLGLEPPLLADRRLAALRIDHPPAGYYHAGQPAAGCLGDRQPHRGDCPDRQRGWHTLWDDHRLQPVHLPQPAGRPAPAAPGRCASPKSWTCPAGRPAIRTCRSSRPAPASAMCSTAFCARKAMISGWWTRMASILGVCRQRDVLNPPRLRLILVDHNEPRQALGRAGRGRADRNPGPPPPGEPVHPYSRSASRWIWWAAPARWSPSGSRTPG